MIHRKSFISLLFFTLLSVFLSSPAQAQTGGQIDTHFIEVSEADSATAATINIVFTVSDGQGNIIQGDIDSGDIHLVEEDRNYPVNLLSPNSDIYIILALDASGSMEADNAIQSMRDAAIESVKTAPQGAYFAILSFSDQIEVGSFSTDKNTIVNEINQVTTGGSGTCLFDAAYRSLSLLSQASQGRRAVLLFTDGRDELASGGICSRNTAQDVIDLASQSGIQIPIHTIGMQSANLDQEPLTNLAANTGGINKIVGQDDLFFAFREMMSILLYQWTATAQIYPADPGQHTAWLELSQQEGGTYYQSDTFTYQTNRGYTPPPEISLINFSYANGNLAANIYHNNAASITNVKVEIYKEGEVVVAEFDSPLRDQIIISRDLLEIGETYAIIFTPEVSGENSADFPLFGGQFTFDPPEVEVTFEIVGIELDRSVPEFIVEIRGENLADATNYRITLVDEQTKQREVDLTVENITDNYIRIPLENVPYGSYAVTISARDVNDALIDDATSSVAYDKLGFFIGLFSAIKSSPVIIAFLVMIAVLGIGAGIFFYTQSRSNKSSDSISQILRRPQEFEIGGGLQDEHDLKNELIQKQRQRAKEEAARIRREQLAAQKAKDVRVFQETQGEIEISDASLIKRQVAIAGKTPMLVVEQVPDGQHIHPTPIRHSPFIVGRSPKDANLVIQYDKVSRRHIKIIHVNGKYYVEDMGSKNHTYLNNRLITGREKLESGMVIGLGKYVKIRFELREN